MGLQPLSHSLAFQRSDGVHSKGGIVRLWLRLGGGGGVPEGCERERAIGGIGEREELEAGGSRRNEDD